MECYYCETGLLSQAVLKHVLSKDLIFEMFVQDTSKHYGHLNYTHKHTKLIVFNYITYLFSNGGEGYSYSDYKDM